MPRTFMLLIVPPLLLAALVTVKAQTDSTGKDTDTVESVMADRLESLMAGTGIGVGFFAGVSFPAGQPAESNDLIPSGAAPGIYFSGHISIPVAGAFCIGVGFGVDEPLSNSLKPDPLAERLYPDYHLLSNDIKAFSTINVTVGPAWRFRTGRLSVEPAILAGYALLVPHNQYMFLKRRGSNEYRSILEETAQTGGFTITPTLTLGYRLREDGIDAGIQFRAGYLGTSFAITPTTTDQPLAGDIHSITTEKSYTHRSFFVMLGLYRVL